MTVQPAPKMQELVNDINTLVSKHRKPANTEVNRLDRQAESLKKKINWSDYYDILGQISGLKDHKDDMISKFENAIKLEPNNYEIRRNYLSCLHNSGLIELATNQARLLDSQFPSNDSSLLLFKSYFYLCRFRDALQVLGKLERNNENLSAVTIFDNANLTDDDAQNLHKLAFGVIKAKNLYFSASEIEIVDNCVCYTIYVDAPIEDIFDINWELDRILVENLEDTRSDVLMFQYSSINVLEEKRNYERIV